MIAFLAINETGFDNLYEVRERDPTFSTACDT